MAKEKWILTAQFLLVWILQFFKKKSSGRSDVNIFVALYVMITWIWIEILILPLA